MIFNFLSILSDDKVTHKSLLLLQVCYMIFICYNALFSDSCLCLSSSQGGTSRGPDWLWVFDTWSGISCCYFLGFRSGFPKGIIIEELVFWLADFVRGFAYLEVSMI